MTAAYWELVIETRNPSQNLSYKIDLTCMPLDPVAHFLVVCEMFGTDILLYKSIIVLNTLYTICSVNIIQISVMDNNRYIL